MVVSHFSMVKIMILRAKEEREKEQGPILLKGRQTDISSHMLVFN